MKISYELNPPKIVRGDKFDPAVLRSEIRSMVDRASKLAGLAWGMHLTDSVLGIPRLSSVTAADRIRQALGTRSPALSCSLRSRDRNFTSLAQAVTDAVLVGVESVLILMGDKSADGVDGSGIVPTKCVTMLREGGYDHEIKLDLSFPARVGDCPAKSVRKKLEARPHSFVTQSISSLSDLGEIVDLARPCGIKVAAVVMVPSEKNRKSASAIGLDWSAYEREPVDFIKRAGEMSDRVLITSPNSFSAGLELLRQLS